MKKILLLIVLLVMVLFVTAEAGDNPDNPNKGTWNFNPQKVWSIDTAGEESLAQINMIGVFDDGTLLVHDGKNKKYYIFDKDGNFKKSFGKRGEGPGEIKWISQARFSLVNDKIIIGDMDKLHYFSKEGEFIKSVRNNMMQRRPVVFLTENEFIHAPLLRLDMGSKPSMIKRYNMETDTEKEIAAFPVFAGGVARSGGNVIAMVVMGLTPMMIVGYNDNTLYYGMNDSYAINICDMDGKKIGQLKLDREPQTVTETDKRSVFGNNSSDPKEMVEQIIKSMPDKACHFSNIEVHNGLIYVYAYQFNRKNKQQIDIFSPDGTYLYKGLIQVDDGFTINANPVIKKDCLYLALEDQDGEVSVAKFKITMPK